MSLNDETVPAPPSPTGSAVTLPVLPGFEVLELIGRGGMGRVYKAHDRRLGRTVAIKMLLDPDDESLVARFHAESRAVASLHHPNIAQIFEIGEFERQPFLVLEYVDGGSLASRKNAQPLPASDAAKLVETLSRAIDYCHQNGVLHRDLKPGNVLLTADGTPKVTDFGLAKRLHDNQKLTNTGDVLGTPSHMAPEQASGGGAKAGPGVDIYALGSLLYELIAGRPPFQGPDSVQTLMMVLTMDPVPPSQFVPGIPRDLETICLKCLEKLPRGRYAKAADLADDLRRYLDGKPVLARPAGLVTRAVKWAKRRPVLAIQAAMFVVAVFVIFAGSLYVYFTNLELAAKNRETNISLRLAQEAIDRMLVRLADQLAPQPQSSELRRVSLEDAKELYERLTSLRPSDEATLSQSAEAVGKLGSIYHDLGRLDDAQGAYARAKGMYRGLLARDPAEPAYILGVAAMDLNQANLELKRNDGAGAESLVLGAFKELAKHPKLSDAEALRTRSALHTTLAVALQRQKKTADALKEHAAAIELRRNWRKLEDSAEAKNVLSASLSNQASILLVQNQPADALRSLTEAALLLHDEKTPRSRYFLGQVHANRALALELLKKDADALKAHGEAIDTFTSLVDDFSSVPEYRYLLAKEHLNVARFHGPAGRSAEALKHLRIAGPILESLAREFPDNRTYQSEAALQRQIKIWIDEDLEAARKKASP